MNPVRVAASLVVVQTDAADASDDVVRCALGVYIVPRIDAAGMIPGLRRRRTTCELQELIVCDVDGSTIESHTDTRFPVTVSDEEPLAVLVTAHGVAGLSKLSYSAVAIDTTEYQPWRARRAPTATRMPLAELDLSDDS